MDGKHFKIDPPLSSGSLFHNYKGDFNIGTNGRISDGRIWKKSSLKRALQENSLHIPLAQPLPGIDDDFRFIIVGDEGFPITTSVLTSYPGDQCRNHKIRRIFNYRLSRARRCSENAFGVLGARFQIFRAAMRYDPEDASQIVLATICLHNWLRNQTLGRAMYTPPTFVDEKDKLTKQVQWRDEVAHGIVTIGKQGGNHHRRDALNLRDRWCEYFLGVGAVPWQERMVR